MKKILVVVDMQNDFLTGTLANKSAVNIIPNIKREIESGKYDHIIFTRDTHNDNYLETQEGKRLPVVHCIKESTGWEVCEELLNANHGNATVSFIDKPTFGYDKWDEYIGLSNSEFTFTGVCTDICVISNALAIKSALPNAQVKCLADCCAPLFGDLVKQEAAFEIMTSCQIDVIR